MEIRRLRVQAAASRRRSASSRAGELFKNVMFSPIFYPFKQKMPEIATIFSEITSIPDDCEHVVEGVGEDSRRKR